MTPSVTVQVSRYFEYLDEVAPPVSFEELEERAGRVVLEPNEVALLRRPAYRPERSRRVIIGWAAAIIVLLLVGGAALLFRDTESRPVIAPAPARFELPDRFQHSMVGRTAPETTGELIGGGAFDIAEHRGERVVVMFWATWCRPCTEQVLRLQDLATENDHITVVSVIYADDPVSASFFMADNNIQMRVLDKTATDNYPLQWDVESIPSTFLIDESGTISAGFVGVLEDSELNQLLNGLGWCATPCADTDDAVAIKPDIGSDVSEENLGDVALHEHDESGDPWVGLQWQQSDDGQVLSDEDDSGTPTGMYVQGERPVSERMRIYLVTDAKPDGTPATVEMIWTVAIGDGVSRELDGALERETTSDLSFHLDCASTDTAWPVVALVDANLDPVQAWALVGLWKFVVISVESVDCE